MECFIALAKNKKKISDYSASIANIKYYKICSLTKRFHAQGKVKSQCCIKEWKEIVSLLII